MSRGAVGRDTELTLRMFLTMFFLAVGYLAFMAVLLAVGVPVELVIIGTLVMLGIQYLAADKIALRAMRARIVGPEEAPKLHAMIERLSVMAGIPKPQVAIADMPIPNAFATGRNPKNSVMAVTTGLMNRLSDPELEGVLAHEISHIRNRDVTVLTMAHFPATIAAMVMQMFAFSMMFGGYGYGGGRRGGGGGVGAIMIIFLASIVVYYTFILILIPTLSRYREFAADRGGALLTGQPGQLASALMRISGGMGAIPQEDMRRVEKMNAFFIVPAVKGASLAGLTSTHPKLEKRIERLEMLQRQLEGG